MRWTVAAAVMVLGPGLLGRPEAARAGWGSVKGSGTEKSEKRSLEAFTAVDVGGAFEVVITCQKSQMCEITTDDNLLSKVSTEVVKGVLRVETKESVSPTRKIKMVLDVKDLTSLDMSGACQATVTGVDNKALAIDLSGAAQVTVSGKSKDVSISLSGAGQIAADGLISGNVKVDCSGAGSVQVHATESLTAHLSGMGAVVYSGNPKKVDKEISGLGSITPK